MADTQKILQGLAAMIGGSLILFFGFDWVASSLGYETSAFCWAYSPIAQLAYIAGYCLALMGFILWAFSFFQNPKPLGLTVGGFMLVFLPPVLPHYIGVSCEAPMSPAALSYRPMSDVGDQSPTSTGALSAMK